MTQKENHSLNLLLLAGGFQVQNKFHVSWSRVKYSNMRNSEPLRMNPNLHFYHTPVAYTYCKMPEPDMNWHTQHIPFTASHNDT